MTRLLLLALLACSGKPAAEEPPPGILADARRRLPQLRASGSLTQRDKQAEIELERRLSLEIAEGLGTPPLQARPQTVPDPFSSVRSV